MAALLLLIRLCFQEHGILGLLREAACSKISWFISYIVHTLDLHNFKMPIGSCTITTIISVIRVSSLKLIDALSLCVSFSV